MKAINNFFVLITILGFSLGFAACNDNNDEDMDLDSVEEEMFTIEIGDVYTLTSEEGYVSDNHVSGNIILDFQYSEGFDEDDAFYKVIIEFREDIESGTYTRQNDDIWMGIRYNDGTMSESADCRVEQGMVNVERDGDTISGSLDLTGIECTTDEHTVEVTGTFKNVDIKPG
jgi:hypothetical protein